MIATFVVGVFALTVIVIILAGAIYWIVDRKKRTRLK